MAPRPPAKYVVEYANSVVYHEDMGNGDAREVTSTRRKMRAPGSEAARCNRKHLLVPAPLYQLMQARFLDNSHWRTQLETTIKTVEVLPSSFVAQPGWAASIDNFPTDNPAHTCASASARQPPAAGPSAATHGASSSARRSTGRMLRQQSILPYLASTRSLRHTSAIAASPGRDVNHPIFILDNSPCRDNRNDTRLDTRGGAITFQAGSVRFALAPYLDPTLVAVIQHPVRETGLEVEWSNASKRKLAEMAADKGDVFTDGRGVQLNPVASSSTAREAIPTCNGRKRRCVAARSPIAALSTSAPPSASANSKGKGRAV